MKKLSVIIFLVSLLCFGCKKSEENIQPTLLQHEWTGISTNVFFSTNPFLNRSRKIADDNYLRFGTDKKLYAYHNSGNLLTHDTTNYRLTDTAVTIYSLVYSHLFFPPYNSGSALARDLKIASLTDHYLVLTHKVNLDTTINGVYNTYSGLVVDSMKR